MSPTAAIRSTSPLNLPVGVSDFGKLVRGGHTFIDKTSLIEDIIDRSAEVTLITRPRRFGKTLNLSMLQHFFAARAWNLPTAGLFDGLAIAKRPSAMAHQGKYPVIFASLKDIKATSLAEFDGQLRGLISSLCNGYPELLESPRLSMRDRRIFEAMLDKQADPVYTSNALRLLSEMLARHYEQKVFILLDEYDTPIHSAYLHGFYEELMPIMRNLLGAALKDNPYLSKGVVTGILKVGKEGMFSDLNNPDVRTVLDEGYGQYFGFTESETYLLLEKTGLSGRNPALEGSIKDWYNGYRIGGRVIYNPWSIIRCLQLNGQLEPYWANTSGSDLLKSFMASADAEFKQDLERLVAGESVQEIIDPTLAFGSLGSDSTTLWSLMLFAGYLTALEVEPAGRQKRCRLTIPNREIRYEYDSIIQSWFSGPSETSYREMLRGLTRGDPKAFEAGLREYLLTSASAFDTGGWHPEKVYHVLVLGMMVGLKESHAIASNRESGYGRSDLALIPKKRDGGTGVVLEFKQTKEREKLQATAEAALAQIEVKRYDAELRQHAVKKVLGIGLGFCGKEVAISYKSW